MKHNGIWPFIRVLVLFLASVYALVSARAEDQRPQPDEMIDRIRQLRSHRLLADRPIKCGLQFALDVIDNWPNLSEVQRQSYGAAIAPDPMQKIRVIGHFQVHYDTTGANTPSLLDPQGAPIPGTAEEYIDSVGKYFNYAWSFEIDTLGFDRPPFENGQSYYNVYVKELGGLLYGDTWPVHPINTANPPRFDSYIEVDNDYQGYYSPGIAGLEVTSAHEFNHSIQIGSYGYWPTDVYFLELTATWMEDVVHTDVNDYYQYLTNVPFSNNNSIFAYPDARFTLANGSIEYSRVVWGKFVEKRFSRDIMLNTWKYIRQVPALTALDRALTDAGSSFTQAFLEWAVWNINTGANCDTLTYYSEGRHYPLMRLRPVVQYVSPQTSIADTIQVLSSSYHVVLLDASRQMMLIVSNFNQANATSGQTYAYAMSNSGDMSFKHLSNGLYVKLNVNDPLNWATQELDSSRQTPVPSLVSSIVIIPNPFVPENSSQLKFRLPPTTAASATLAIISTSLSKVFSGEVSVKNPSEPFIEWNGQNDQNTSVSSGIYFYQITVGDQQYVGKFAVIRK